MLRERWKHPDAVLYGKLISAYSEPHRRYHTLQHLEECFARFDELADLAEHPRDVELAIWSHDAIYDPRRTERFVERYEKQARANLARSLARR